MHILYLYFIWRFFLTLFKNSALFFNFIFLLITLQCIGFYISAWIHGCTRVYNLNLTYHSIPLVPSHTNQYPVPFLRLNLGWQVCFCCQILYMLSIRHSPSHPRQPSPQSDLFYVIIYAGCSSWAIIVFSKFHPALCDGVLWWNCFFFLTYFHSV